jgi:class 3 adenylate cyclase
MFRSLLNGVSGGSAEISTRPAHLLSRDDARAAAEAGRFRGWVVKQTGDGMLATFVGPARAIR